LLSSPLTRIGGMAGGRFHLTLPPMLLGEPVVHALSTRFGLVTNIARAHLDERGGWMILELDGPEETLAEAMSWLQERDVRVERIEG
jgi:ABC-type methionine transport system ATPase subunit